MAVSEPKLRSDLRIIPQKTNGTSSFVVKHPGTRRFFRLKEVEHFIARQLDGSTPPGVIQERVHEQFNARLAPRTLEQFIEKLRRMELLQPALSEDAARPPERMIRGGILALRLAAVDPDRLFASLSKRLRFLFTPIFLAISSASIAIAAGVAISDWDEIIRQLSRILSFETVVLAWVALLVVTVLHEFAHGITLRHFGGEVRELGFLLLYFQPALYVNVSDAWLLPRRNRLWVMFAGAYFEAFVWALAAITWRMTEPGTWISAVSLVVLITSTIKTFLNLNPLIKLDGYYLLSDLLDIPNLREKSFRYLRELLPRLAGRGQGAEKPSRRDRWVYVAYGLLSAAYSLSLLWLVAASVGSTLVDRYQGVGFLVFLCLLTILLRRPAAALVRGSARLLRPGKGLLAAARWCLKMVFLVGLAAGAGAALYHVRMDLRIAGSFRVLPTHHADVRAETEGIIQEVFVDEGDRVQKGELVAQLSDRDLLAERRKLDAEIREKEAALRMLKAGPREEERKLGGDKVATARTRLLHAGRRYKEAKKLKEEKLLKARAGVEKMEERLRYSRNELARLEALLSSRIISPREFEEAEQAVSLARKEVDEAGAELKIILADDLAVWREEFAVAREEMTEAEGALSILRAGARPEEIEAMEALVARLEAQRAYIKGNIDLLHLTSPSEGVVISPKLKEKVGQQVKRGDLVAEVRELETTKVDITVSEKDIGDVKVGQDVVLKARAFPGETFQARVTAIASAATSDGEWNERKVILVTTEIQDLRGLLKPEMTGMAKISCGEHRLYEVLTRRVARYLRVEFWSWW